MRLKLRAAAAAWGRGKDRECYHRRRPPRLRRGRTDARPLPAAIDHELPAAAVGNPHASAVPAPAVALRAARIGQLTHQPRMTARANIDLAHLVALLVAVALQPDLAVPARARAPVATAVIAVVIAVVVAIVAIAVAVAVTVVVAIIVAAAP